MGKDIKFTFTRDQQVVVVEYFGKDINELEDWQICELLDQLIDEKVLIKKG